MAAGTISSRQEEATSSQETRTLISRLAPLLNRPLLIGCAAVLASLVCCGVLAKAAPVIEVKSHPAALRTVATPHPQAAKHEEVHPLFLAMLGLAALALSQTRGSDKAEPAKDVSCAGKNGVRGQKLPKILRPQPVLAPLDPASGVIARKHHDDIVGLESVGGFGMLHQ